MLALLALSIALTQAPCDFPHGWSGTRMITGDERSAPVVSYSNNDDGRCASALIVGRLTYSDADDDVIEVPFGGHAVFTERSAAGDRELTITRGENGGVVRSYRRNGRAAEYDDDGRRWLAGLLPQLLMDAGINVGPRVARWRAQGGVDRVLAGITTIHSSGSKRAHYEELMKGRLADADLDRLVRHAGNNVQSSGDLRAILEKAAPTRGGVRSGSALEEAITHMASSGDKTAVLALYGQTNDREMLISVMRMARTIQSSGDRSRLLRDLAARYLATDRALYSAFYDVAETVPSSGDLRNVLTAAIPFAAKVPDQVLVLLDASRSIASSGDRAEVLIALVESGAVKGSVARERFIDVASSVPSSGDRSRVLLAASRF